MGSQLHADLILYNGPIYTAYGQPYVDGLAVRQGRIVAVGDSSALEGLRGADTRAIDLEGRLALPAFNDCHLHMAMFGRSLSELDLGSQHVRSIREALDEIRKRAAAAKPGEWITGGRYDHVKFAERRHPTMEELDAVAPNNPVYISRCCGHVGVGNSLAFAAAGVTENTADPNGGHIEKRDGRLTGQMQENAQRLIFTAIPALTLEETVTAIENAANQLLKFGVASVMDAGVGFDGLMDMAAFQTARRSGRLPLRAYLAILAGPDGILDECHRLGLVTGAGDEFLKIGPAKLFADGSIGGLTAAMSQPYLNDGVNRGLFIYSDQDMNEMVADYMTRGYQVATHAIGDAAIEQVLSAYEKGISAGGSARLRHRIEHCEFTTFDQIRRMKSAGILPIPQPCFLTHFSDAYAQAVGAEATAASSPLRTWIENGMSPATSTDSPICPPDTLANLAAMLTRKGPSGVVYGEDQTIGLERAIESMTFAGAYASHSETVKGKLLPGHCADIAILDRDIRALSPEEIASTKVDATIIDGRVVFDRYEAVACEPR